LPITARRSANSTPEFPAEPTGASSDLTGGIRKAAWADGTTAGAGGGAVFDGRQVGASAPIQSGLARVGNSDFYDLFRARYESDS